MHQFMHEAKIHQPKFGQIVKRYRLERGMSQAAFGNVVGVTQWTISRIEKGLTDKGLAVEKLAAEMLLQRDAGSAVSEICKRVALSEEFEALVSRILNESRA